MSSDTTLEYNSAAGVRTTVTASTGSTAVALPAVRDPFRRVRIMSSVRCFLRFGASDVAATVAATSLPIAANVPEVVKVPLSATHFAVIRDDTSDGNVTLTPAAG